MMRRVIIFIALQTLSSGLVFLMFVPGLPGPKWMWSLVPMPMQIACVAWFVLGTLKLQRSVRAHDGRVCWHCSYILEGLENRGLCPECGREYDVHDLREKWMVPKVPAKVPAPRSEAQEAQK